MGENVKSDDAYCASLPNWISHDQGLFHFVGDNRAEPIPWATLGSKASASALIADTRNGLWLGFYRGGVAYFTDGRVRATYSSRNGLGEGRVGGFQLDPDDTLWVATEGGLSRVKDGRVVTLTSNNGLPCDAVDGVVEGDDHSFWLNMACGLVRIPRTELDAWAAGSKRAIQATVFDASDGVRGHANTGAFSPRMAKSNDGRLWFLTGVGVSVIDPHHVPVNKLPPPVHIEKIVADRKIHWENLSGGAASNLRLPALTRELEIDYAALSLVAPEKVRFKYKLEGHDSEWTDGGMRRQAFYNDLAPRNYRFRVMAANNDGVWNEAGASLDFSVAPAYYQTSWFAASIVAAFLALLTGLYHLRLRYLKHQFNVRLEARVGERTRIARDLHDTLLQSFQGVLLRFSSLKYLIPDRPAEAVESLEHMMDEARAAVTEGRDAVQGLRASMVITNDLARAIGTFGGLAAEQTGANGPEFRLHVEGKSRDLPPLVRDEVYRIACECLRNAFRHANASRIEVEIHYDQRQLRMRVRDDGKGIDPQFLSAGGRAGHHGLPGLHERAELAGGKLSIWSQPGSGTEIELTIPASIAYQTPAPEQRLSAGKGAE